MSGLVSILEKGFSPLFVADLLHANFIWNIKFY